MLMTEEECKSVFILAGVKVLAIKPLIDGYGYDPKDSRFYETVPRCVWWFVKTEWGWIEIGWRKRVISIDWSDTSILAEVTEDSVTKSMQTVHAYSVEDAIKYLRVWHEFARKAGT